MAALRVCALALSALLLVSPALGQGMGQAVDAHATFYGGLDASGTMGGACGYGNLYSTGYGTNTAAASGAIWNGGAICGACWNVWCVNSKYCRSGASVTVTVTNMCPQGSEGGWCDQPRTHLDMAFPAWIQIATDKVAGVISTQMKRVPCTVDGGVSFTITGHAYYLQVLVFNVGGSGDVAKLEVSTDNGNSYTALRRNWGSMWTLSDTGFVGNSLSFRITNGLQPDVLEVIGACGSNWSFGSTCKSGTNFASGSYGAASSLRNRPRKGVNLPSWLKPKSKPAPYRKPAPKRSLPKPSPKPSPASHRRRRGKRGLGLHRLRGAKHRHWSNELRAHA